MGLCVGTIKISGDIGLQISNILQMKEIKLMFVMEKIEYESCCHNINKTLVGVLQENRMIH